MAINTIYPPIIDTYMPAFVASGYEETKDEYFIPFKKYYEHNLATDDYTEYDIPTPQTLNYYELDGATYILSSDTYLVPNKEYYVQKQENIFELAVVPTPVNLYQNMGKCKIYFSISPYNSYFEEDITTTEEGSFMGDIINAQITVRNQNTNLSMLKKDRYPCDVALKRILIDTNIKNDYKYYIELTSDDMRDDVFQLNSYYQIQIRFTSVHAQSISIGDDSYPQSIDAWLTTNLDNFSEWSTVCLIRGISQPIISFLDFKENTIGNIPWSIARTRLQGSLTFKDEMETEKLKSYRIKLYDSKNTLLTDSGIIYSNIYNNVNAIDYVFKYGFSAKTIYNVDFEYTTQNLYTEIKHYQFQIEAKLKGSSQILFTGKKDVENGCVELRVRKDSNEIEPYTGTIIIRRTSSKSNFTIWEDLHMQRFENRTKKIDYSWRDFTIESGVWYVYAIQNANSASERSEIIKFIDPVMLEFEDMFLADKERQLKISFNPTISSFRKTYAESKIDTLGSKYPYIRRNGNLEYAEFQISGLISSEMDPEGLFFTKNEAYDESQEYYEQYNNDNGVTIHNDYIFEKAFRDKVIEFLYSNDKKLFRSATEGNFIVRLMDVSLSPENRLGRMLYNFSATVYEIEEFNIDNCEEIGILSERHL